MSNIIKHICIDNLFGTTNIDWELNPSVNVLVGQNGSGKSTILKIVSSILQKKRDAELDLCRTAKIILDDSSYVAFGIASILKDSHIRLINDIKNIQDITIVNQLDTLLEIINLSHEEELKKSIQESPLFPYSAGFNSVQAEFISTINLSANSIQNLTTSSGQNTTFLDFEITNEVQRLLSCEESKSLKEKLLSALNNLFSETQKTIEFNKNKLSVKLANGEEIPFSKLSSGERQVIFIFLKVVIASVDGALILMDEPEISLHLSWQEKLLNEIRRINTTSQIIIVTHSPAMLMNGWMDSFVDISDIMTDVSASSQVE